MKRLLFINACVNRETSRTACLSKELINILKEKESYDYITELVLEEENIQALNSETLRKKTELSEKRQFDDDMFKYARQFTEADCVIIGAPYWDLAFPAMLKNFIEAICVVGVTYHYNEKGIPCGMCKADKIYYVTTSGGYIGNNNFGFDMVQALGKLFGINDSKCITAEGLDIITNDAKAILNAAIDDLPNKI